MKRMNDFQSRYQQRAQARIEQTVSGMCMDDVDVFFPNQLEQFQESKIVRLTINGQTNDINAFPRQVIADSSPLLQTAYRDIEPVPINGFGKVLHHALSPADPQMRRHNHDVDPSLNLRQRDSHSS